MPIRLDVLLVLGCCTPEESLEIDASIMAQMGFTWFTKYPTQCEKFTLW